MWTLFRHLLLAGMVVLWSAPGFCEYYQYRDQNGVLRYTDDLASVPPDQRPDVKTHQSIESKPVQKTTATATNKNVSPSEASPKKGAQPSGRTWQERNSQEKQELDQMQAELKETFKALQAERTALNAKTPPEGASFKQRAGYNKQVQALNLKIADYESKLNAFNEKVSVYNAQSKK